MLKKIGKKHKNVKKINGTKNANVTDVNWASYKKQRNLCVTQFGRTKKDYFQNLNVKD